MICANAEASSLGEQVTQTYTTNGGNWVLIANVPTVGGGVIQSPSISGTGTSAVLSNARK